VEAERRPGLVEGLVGDVGDVGATLPEGGDPLGVDVDAHDGEAGPAQVHEER
jgi:hypothetical protein